MIASIQLNRFTAKPSCINPGDQHVWPITIQATGTNISSEIFVYRAGKHGDPIGGDAFSCIASASQMYELPANRAQTLTTKFQLPFYRASQMELFSRSPKELDSIWRFVQEDVQRLLDNYNVALNNQSDVAVVLHATQPVIDQVVDFAQPQSVPTTLTNVITIPSGTPIIVQPTPPNADVVGAVWVQTDPTTGNSIRAYTIFPSSEGGDGNWHSQMVTDTNGVNETTNYMEAPGI